MLNKIKNTTVNDIIINDLGITISANTIYDLSYKSFATSDDLLNHISNNNILFIKSESPEVLYDRSESLRYLVTGVIALPKVSETGENVVLRNEHGHLEGNNVVNWTFSEYVSHRSQYNETMYLELDKTLILNSFTVGSNNVLVTATISMYEWNSDFNDYIRINPDIRLNEYYCSTITMDPSMNTNMIQVSNIMMLKVGKIYQIETKDGSKLYRKIDSVDMGNNTITLNLNIMYANIPMNAKLVLVDRVLCENSSNLTSSAIKWGTPLKITGNEQRKIVINIKNEDISEPGTINGSLNGWIG